MRREHRREREAPRLDDGIRRVRDVVAHRSVVRVDHDLHGVPQVVHVPPERGGLLLRRRRRDLRQVDEVGVRVLVRRRIGVPDPHQPAVDDRGVGVGVEAQERRGLRDARGDVSVDHDPAVALDQVRDQQVDVAEAPREQRPLEEAADRDPAVAVVAERGLRLIVGRRALVVELVGSGVHDDERGVPRRALAVVHALAVALERRGADRRDVPEREDGCPSVVAAFTCEATAPNPCVYCRCTFCHVCRPPGCRPDSPRASRSSGRGAARR